jgi:beta-lactamase regulating signal transducer with metallopeptidase domain
MLILPAKLLQNLSPAELESVVGHELLHIRRCDFAMSLLGMFVKVLFWFFPPAWWAVERTIAAAERCVDRDVVERLHARRLDYASALLRVLEIRYELRSLAGVPGMRPIDVTDDRIAGILQDEGARSPRDGLVAWSLVLVAALIILPGRPLDIFGPSCAPAGDCGLLDQSTTGNEGRQ